MKISFLGIYGAVPSKESGNVSILVDYGLGLALIDVSGNPVQAILRANRKVEDLSVVVLTHAHVDHIYGFPSLLHTLYCMGRKRELKVVSDEYTFKFAKSLADLFGLKRSKIGFSVYFFSEEEFFIDDRLQIEMFPGDHGIPSSMVKMKSCDSNSGFLYTSDTRSTSLICEVAKDVNVMIHEASGSHEHIDVLERSGHSSGLQAGMDAECSGVKKLFLCHFGIDNNNAPEIMAMEASKEFNGEVIIPELYKWYEL